MFSNYFLTELRRFEIFWRRRFDNSSRFVRGKANIDSLPSHHSFETSWNLGNFILSDTDTQCSEDLNSRNENEKQTSHKCETNEGSEVHRRENNSRKVNYPRLVERYASTADLWQIILKMLCKSDSFLAFIVESSVSTIAAPLLINLIQDYARASNNLLDDTSVVYKNVAITMSLCRSLLSTLILSCRIEGI
ncbi:hypothetical protein Anas_00774, partial [Armadillidium nasatum]